MYQVCQKQYQVFPVCAAPEVPGVPRMLCVVCSRAGAQHTWLCTCSGLCVPSLWGIARPRTWQTARVIEHRQLWQVCLRLEPTCLELQGSVNPLPGVDDECVARMLWEQAVAAAPAALAHDPACSKCGCEPQEQRAVSLVQQPSQPSMVVRLGWCCVQCCPMACNACVGCGITAGSNTRTGPVQVRMCKSYTSPHAVYLMR